MTQHRGIPSFSVFAAVKGGNKRTKSLLSSILYMLVAAFVLSAPPSFAQAPPISFHAAEEFPVGSAPFTFSVAVGDFNGDGKPDLAVTNFLSTNVSILLGNGDGTFRPATNYAVASNPRGIVVGDFNGDGKLDLAVVNSCNVCASPNSSVSVLLGNGDGTFQAATSYAIGNVSYSLATADLNGDGKLDLVVANLGFSGSFSVLLGNGDGTFRTPTNYPAGLSPFFVAIGDFNGDGKPDLAVAASVGSVNDPGSVAIFLGNGDGTFGPPTKYAAGTNPNFVLIADFNGDGKADLAVTNFNTGNVSILIGKGDGTFAPATNYAVGAIPTSAAAADFNGDGKLDLAVAVSSGESVSILLGNGDGTFGTATNLPVALFPTALVTGDFNGDNKADVAVANQGSNLVEILLGNGDGTFLIAPSYATGPLSVSVATGDFNGDGILDLAVANEGSCFCDNDPSSSVSILLGKGDGTFAPATNLAAGNVPVFVAVGDFNGDGKLDLAVANFFDNDVSILLGNGDGSFGAPTKYYPQGFFPFSIAVGDFNGDGKLDLAVLNGCVDQSCTNITGNISILLGNGDGTFRTGAAHEVGVGPTSLAIGDFNGDGKLDLAVVNLCADQSCGAFSTGVISILLGNGDGTFGAVSNYAVGTSPLSVAVGDFNGDGKLDLVVANQGNTTPNSGFSILLGNGDGTFGAANSYGVGIAPVFVATADFNGDGKLDLVSADPLGSVSILPGNGNGTFGTATYFASGLNPRSIAVGDFNKDGKRDLAMADFEGNVSILLNTAKFNPPDFFIRPISPLTISAGGSGLANVTVNPANGFSSAVDLSVSGAPVGVMAVPSPAQVTPSGGNSASSILNVSVSPVLAPTNFTLTVTGTSGTLTHSATADVTVTATTSSIGNLIGNLLGQGCIDNGGIANALTSKLSAAQGAGNIQTEINILTALKNQINAQAGKHIATTCNIGGVAFNPVTVLLLDVQGVIDSLRVSAIPDPITGYVVNSSGVGVAGAVVSIVDTSTNMPVATATTDITGFYFFATMSVLKQGSSYTVAVTGLPAGFVSSTPAMSPAFPWLGTGITIGNFVLNP